MKTKLTPQLLVLTAMIISAGIWRLVVSSGFSTLGNFTPVGAMALFGGCYYSNKKLAFVVPLLTLLLSDALLYYFIYAPTFSFFYEGMFTTYMCFALMVVLGMFIKQVTFRNVLAGAVAAALLHWVLTDFAVYMQGVMYPKTLNGFAMCYIAALPFLKNMLIGNILFSGILFGSFELAKRKFPKLSAV